MEEGYKRDRGEEGALYGPKKNMYIDEYNMFNGFMFNDSSMYRMRTRILFNRGEYCFHFLLKLYDEVELKVLK